jgi:hypothetical protein
MDAITRSDDEVLFDRVMRSLEGQITNIGAHLTIDSKARFAYMKEIKQMSDRLRADAVARRISWGDAARQAQETRNLIMGLIRARSTPVGRAFAESMKLKGYSLNQLIAVKTLELHGGQAIFSRLSSANQNTIYASIVASAGRSNAHVSRAIRNVAYAGRGALFLAVALSTYKIATSSNRAAAFQKELAINGASVAGGIAGGALAGLACGPAAPVCVTVGAFVGGAIAALGTDFVW